MEENSINTSVSENYQSEPVYTDNSIDFEETNYPKQDLLEGQSQDPSEELILGKFKSVEDLSKAYVELQRHQGQSSQELGELRRESESMNGFRENLETVLKIQNSLNEIISADKEKYNQPEYFQEPSFRELYKEAFMALEGQIDTDKFINLLEAYVNSRVNAHERAKSAENETQSLLNSMTYDKNSKTSFTPPKKSFDEMTPQEVDALLDRLI